MGDFSSARLNTEEGASQGARSCKTYVSSRFAFRVAASWGAHSHSTVVLNRFACPIAASWGAQSHNEVVSSRFVFHGVPNPGTSVVPTTSTSSIMLWLRLVVCLAALRRTSYVSHPPLNKRSLAVTPIYHFHFNLCFLKAPLALRWSQAPCHSVTSYAPACAPHVMFYFRCLFERYSTSVLVLVASVPLKLLRVPSHFSLACLAHGVASRSSCTLSCVLSQRPLWHCCPSSCCRN